MPDWHGNSTKIEFKFDPFISDYYRLYFSTVIKLQEGCGEKY